MINAAPSNDDINATIMFLNIINKIINKIHRITIITILGIEFKNILNPFCIKIGNNTTVQI